MHYYYDIEPADIKHLLVRPYKYMDHAIDHAMGRDK